MMFYKIDLTHAIKLKTWKFLILKSSQLMEQMKQQNVTTESYRKLSVDGRDIYFSMCRLGPRFPTIVDDSSNIFINLCKSYLMHAMNMFFTYHPFFILSEKNLTSWNILKKLVKLCMCTYKHSQGQKLDGN